MRQFARDIVQSTNRLLMLAKIVLSKLLRHVGIAVRKVLQLERAARTRLCEAGDGLALKCAQTHRVTALRRAPKVFGIQPLDRDTEERQRIFERGHASLPCTTEIDSL